MVALPMVMSKVPAAGFEARLKFLTALLFAALTGCLCERAPSFAGTLDLSDWHSDESPVWNLEGIGTFSGGYALPRGFGQCRGY